jgi:glycosyltransferase involved in cell wall biosynthesis
LAWELLLIDNNSTDQTRHIADLYSSTLPLRYFFEPKQGLSNARNRALQEYRGELLVFTDDDVVLDAAWLLEYSLAQTSFAGANYFGGRILPLWNGDKPGWLKDPTLALLSGVLVHYDIGDDNRLFAAGDPTPFGASFAVRRGLAESVGLFSPALGVAGSNTARGEETEYLQRAKATGASGAYVGKAVCYHVQDPMRFKFRYLYQYGIATGRTECLLGQSAGGSLLAEFSYLIKGLWQLCKGRGDRFRQCVINAGIQKGLRIG